MALSEYEKKVRHRRSTKKYDRKINEKAKRGDPEAAAYKQRRYYSAKFSTAKAFINEVGKIEDVKSLIPLLDKRLKDEK